MNPNIFNPRSIAIVGASKVPGKLSYDILSNLVNLGYEGKIFPINTKGDEVLGLPILPSISALPEIPDLVLIIIPAPFVNAIVEECGQFGIENIVVISAGFKEIGGEGIKRENELKKIVDTFKINLVGPNCLGIINTKILMNASFAEGMPSFGNVSLISQSGAMAVAMIDWAYESGLGFAKIISMGNKTGVNENELLEYFGEDSDTKVILMYLESIADGDEFLRLARKISLKKPIIIVKSGTSEAGTKAISSHTGSLAGSDIAIETAFRQGGVIRAQTVEDLFYYAKAFSYQNPPKGDRVGIITNAGGPGIMAADEMARAGLQLAKLSQATQDKLAEGLPSTAALSNPVDVIGDALADRYRYAIDVLLASGEIDSLVVILTPQIMTEVRQVASITTALARQYPDVTVLSAFVGGESIERGRQIFRRHRFPNYTFPEEAIDTLQQMQAYSTWKDTEQERIEALKLLPASPRSAATDAIFAHKNPGNRLDFAETKLLCQSYGIHVPDIRLAKSADEATKHAEQIGYPVVLKIASPDIYHKTDAGGIRVDLQNAAEVQAAFEEILTNVKAHMPQAKIDGITIEPMLSLGKEIIIGVNRDPQFGHMLVFGLGGIYVEVLKDVTFRIAPVTKAEALAMIDEIKTVSILKGVRGEKAVDFDAIADVIVRVGQIVTDYPQISEFEMNPLIVSPDRGAIAVDMKCIV